jgi:1-deoxy-D-xylulose-5-phosphate reductoisomerase
MTTLLTILGATGSVGIHTLDVIAQHPKRFKVLALTAHHNIELLFKQCQHYQPLYAVVSTQTLAENLQQRLQACGLTTTVLFGPKALAEVASLTEVDTVVAAIVGAAGLLPTLAAIKAKKRVLLANKEALVMAGPLLIEEAKRSEAILLPIDSEHNAILQCLHGNYTVGVTPKDVAKVTLTASGGALRHKPLDKLDETTPLEACQHPNWIMGRKISVDSATLMNKGFEVIEAYFLFGLSLDQIEVVLHPQSIVHSLVSYRDGSVLAQLGCPDMRIPISYALAWPQRLTHSVPSLDLVTLGQLDFKPVDEKRYPCLGLAVHALKIGGTATTILNAANEVAVDAFLEEKISFTAIAEINKQVLETIHSRPVTSVEMILEDDGLARAVALELIEQHGKTMASESDAVMMDAHSAIL